MTIDNSLFDYLNLLLEGPYKEMYITTKEKTDNYDYVSKNEAIPTYHCWLCNESGPITKLLFDLTGSKSKELIFVELQSRHGARAPIGLGPAFQDLAGEIWDNIARK